MIWTALTALISPVTNYLDKRQTIKAAQKERSDTLKDKELTTQLKRIENGQESDIEMDNNARKLSGWMDDVSFFVFLIPAVLAFYPPALPHIEAGFDALNGMPEWYQMALGMMLVAVWGFRRLITPIAEVFAKNLAKKFGA